MKQHWPTYELKDVCTSDLGKTLNKSKDEGQLFPYLCSINIQWDRIDLSTLKEAKFSEADKLKYSVQKGDLLICEGGDIGRAAIWDRDYEILYQNALHRVRFNDTVLARFCLFYLRNLKEKGILDSRYGKGVTIKHLVKSSLLSIPIPVPPLPDQRRIVEELDCLIGIIEKQKEQLEQLDALAQSVFYDAFGNPDINDKGWELRLLKEVMTLLNGRAYKQEELLKEGKFPVLRVGNFFSNNDYYYSDLDLDDNKYCDRGDLLYAWSASIGPKIWDGGKVIYHYHIWKVLLDYSSLDKTYAFYLLKLLTSSLASKMHGVAMMHLTKCGMETLNIPIPPLSLQKEFASKIETIEKQKNFIKESIKETEYLFNSRMDYYFN